MTEHVVRYSIQKGKLSLSIARCSCGEFVTSGRRLSVADRRKMEKAVTAHLMATTPPPTDPMERCIACQGILLDGDDVYNDEGGGCIHARCCGPERESYVNADGQPLKAGDPIPVPYKFGSVA